MLAHATDRFGGPALTVLGLALVATTPVRSTEFVRRAHLPPGRLATVHHRADPGPPRHKGISMAFRAPLTNHHADGTPCPPEHKHTTSGKPLHPDCPGRAYSRAVCGCGQWQMQEAGKGYVNESRRRHLATHRAPEPNPSQDPKTRATCAAPTRTDVRSTAPASHFPEVPVPRDLTVGYLLSQLHDLDPSLRVRLAVNPDFPFAHFVGASIVISDRTVFIAEDGQEGYLPAAVRDLFSWT